jgi:hypothetical protein
MKALSLIKNIISQVLPGSEGRGRGRGQGEEMTQTMCAYMNI